MPKRELQFQPESPRNLFASWRSGQVAVSALGVDLNKQPADDLIVTDACLRLFRGCTF